MGLDDGGFGDDLSADNLVADDWEEDAAVSATVATAPIKKQGFSIYTVMLIMSFVFLTTAAIMAFIELGRLQ